MKKETEMYRIELLFGETWVWFGKVSGLVFSRREEAETRMQKVKRVFCNPSRIVEC